MRIGHTFKNVTDERGRNPVVMSEMCQHRQFMNMCMQLGGPPFLRIESVLADVLIARNATCKTKCQNAGYGHQMQELSSRTTFGKRKRRSPLAIATCLRVAGSRIKRTTSSGLFSIFKKTEIHRGHADKRKDNVRNTDSHTHTEAQMALMGERCNHKRERPF